MRPYYWPSEICSLVAVVSSSLQIRLLNASIGMESQPMILQFENVMLMTLRLSSLLLLFIMCSKCIASPLGRLDWTKSAPLPEPRAESVGGILDERLIVAGGTYWEGSKGNWSQKRFSATTHAFDPDAEKWEGSRIFQYP